MLGRNPDHCVNAFYRSDCSPHPFDFLTLPSYSYCRYHFMPCHILPHFLSPCTVSRLSLPLNVLFHSSVFLLITIFSAIKCARPLFTILISFPFLTFQYLIPLHFLFITSLFVFFFSFLSFHCISTPLRSAPSTHTHTHTHTHTGSSVFYRPKDKAVHADNAKMNFARGGGGDHLALLRYALTIMSALPALSTLLSSFSILQLILLRCFKRFVVFNII